MYREVRVFLFYINQEGFGGQMEDKRQTDALSFSIPSCRQTKEIVHKF